MFKVFYGYINEYNQLRYEQRGRPMKYATAVRKAKYARHTSYIVRFGTNEPVKVFSK